MAHDDVRPFPLGMVTADWKVPSLPSVRLPKVWVAVTRTSSLALQAQLIFAFFVLAIVYLADAVGTRTETAAIRGLSEKSLLSADRTSRTVFQSWRSMRP